MLGRDRLPKYDKGSVIKAEDLNKLRSEVKRLGQVKAAAPLQVTSNATGIHFALTGTEQFYSVKTTTVWNNCGTAEAVLLNPDGCTPADNTTIYHLLDPIGTIAAFFGDVSLEPGACCLVVYSYTDDKGTKWYRPITFGACCCTESGESEESSESGESEESEESNESGESEESGEGGGGGSGETCPNGSPNDGNMYVQVWQDCESFWLPTTSNCDGSME
jgi:hypothetical protein